MAETNNSTCAICGKGYYLCLSCRQTKAYSPWKIHTDTSEHFKIYQILHGLSTGFYTKKEAKEKLENVNLSDLDSFRENIKATINDILSTEVADSKVAAEELTTESEVTDIEPETTKTETTKTSKRKSTKLRGQIN